jgi:hypothetical protein
MALQVQDALSSNIAELGPFYRKKRVFAPPKTREHLAESFLRVDCRALIPIPAIDLNRIVHVPSSALASRYLRDSFPMKLIRPSKSGPLQ